jgi:hypothetical protein
LLYLLFGNRKYKQVILSSSAVPEFLRQLHWLANAREVFVLHGYSLGPLGPDPATPVHMLRFVLVLLRLQLQAVVSKL